VPLVGEAAKVVHVKFDHGHGRNVVHPQGAYRPEAFYSITGFSLYMSRKF
jgi:hypothetical protein